MKTETIYKIRVIRILNDSKIADRTKSFINCKTFSNKLFVSIISRFLCKFYIKSF